jgi:hypothetical protein
VDREKIIGISLLPPMAIARLGGSETPLDSFVWREDPTVHGAAKTVIEPAVTLTVGEDGSVRPSLPASIRFRDGHLLRPVAPFFELWVRLQDPASLEEREEPLTTGLLERHGLSLASVGYVVTAANRKAARRTHDDSNAYMARVEVAGDDHRRHCLKAWTPPKPGAEPLVPEDAPIVLGHVQVIKPLPFIRLYDGADPEPCLEMGVNLSALRLRFTPGRGAVFGPPTTTTAPAPVSGRVYEVVPDPANRRLNSAASWLQYDQDGTKYDSPSPSDTYDGASVNDFRALGVVDDTCDAIIEATLVDRSLHRYRAMARVFCAPTHFAPDRRTFLSLADDLADRDLPSFSQEQPPGSGLDPAPLALLCEALFRPSDEVTAQIEALARRAAGDEDAKKQYTALKDALDYYGSLVQRIKPPEDLSKMEDPGRKSLLEAMRHDDLLARTGDLFQRVLETASQINLDAIRARAIGENLGRNTKRVGDLPATDRTSMDEGDTLFDDKLGTRLQDFRDRQQGIAAGKVSSLPQAPLPYTLAAREIHANLAESESVFDLLVKDAARLRKLIRPPYGALRQLDPAAGKATPPAADHRDPRIPRDGAHDMRMPPYMRDSDGTALSLTRRQYEDLMALLDYLSHAAEDQAAAKGPAAESAAVFETLKKPVRRRIEAYLDRLPPLPETGGKRTEEG